MKRLSLMILSLGVLAACDRAEDGPDADVVAATDQNYAETTYDEAFSLTLDALQYEDTDRLPAASPVSDTACVEVTFDRPNRRITLDFGDGCLGADGRMRRGKVFVDYTGRYYQSGTVVTTTFGNYFVDDVQVRGQKVVENVSAGGNLRFDVAVDGALDFPDGSTLTWVSDRLRERVAGAATPFNIFDDEYQITGTASGTSRAGIDFTAEITAPLLVRLACWQNDPPTFQPVSGVITLQPEGFLARTLDYGDGTCDRAAVLTVGDRSVRITLR